MLLVSSDCFLEFPVSTLLHEFFSGDSRKRKVSDNFCVFSSATEPLGLGLCWFFFLFGASFLRLRTAVFLKTCSCSVFYADPPRAVPVYAHSSQSRRRAIRRAAPPDQSLHTYVHIVWSSPESAFTREWSPVTHPDSSPLTVVCSRFLLSRLKVSTVNCCAAHSIFCLFPKGNRSLSLSLLSFSLLDRDQ